ncbi:dipeptide epimerase [Mariniblastus fucicola]|uniref:Dipeptide epimerase n=1 Tax=Mariniblastus fucicola TaxID=980251 RepID=A0A5B9P6K3_9BACT|nr:dipeptide epimerase [Mariniblastus fucicola]QEG21888.1 L-Ala-D/L-Glu epimerase [Mariniblastus fucicola]
MKMKLHPVHLPLKHPFTISRGTLTTQPALYVELEHDGVVGFGEVTENTYYGHTFDSISASLEKARPHLEKYVDGDPLEVWHEMLTIVDGDMFALSALDIAAHDLKGKRSGTPTWQNWGLDWKDVVPSSYTIGISSIEKMVAKLQEQPDWPVYKIKLGTENDLEIVRRLRQHTQAKFRVDANCGWTSAQAIENSKELAELDVEFIEQPLPVEAAREDKLNLFEQSALPILADEDCQIMSDIEKCHGLYHGVNVKICKCGGLTPALSMLRQARSLGMKTMVGCMIESSVGISGAAQLLPLLDFADLDGAILLRDEPATGLQIRNGVVSMPQSPGCGSSIDFEKLHDYKPAGATLPNRSS